MARRKDDSPSSRYREELMEREIEERIETKRKHSSHFSEPQRREKNKTKPPILLRVLTWCGVILLCFVGGYLGTSYLLKVLDQPIFDKREKGGPSEKSENYAAAFLSPDSSADPKLDMQKVVLSLFYPKGSDLVQEKAEIIAHTREDNIREAVLRLLRGSGFFNDETYVKHVFRNVDVVYLDFSSAFLPALNAAGAEASTLFITGVVRTMRENFSPITKVRFLVNSQVVNAGAPVDLTAVWQLSR
ncbi:MAG: GerMN domain-containing protein [Synergistaceae bacterium]|jgi:hypothetical protein|nr:GerMN domain-containing protein [Synergistaceae bacterium]